MSYWPETHVGLIPFYLDLTVDIITITNIVLENVYLFFSKSQNFVMVVLLVSTFKFVGGYFVNAKKMGGIEHNKKVAGVFG